MLEETSFRRAIDFRNHFFIIYVYYNIILKIKFRFLLYFMGYFKRIKAIYRTHIFDVKNYITSRYIYIHAYTPVYTGIHLLVADMRLQLTNVSTLGTFNVYLAMRSISEFIMILTRVALC